MAGVPSAFSIPWWLKPINWTFRALQRVGLIRRAPIIIPLLLLSVMVSGCVTFSGATVQSVCAGISAGHAIFVSFSGRASPQLVAYEAAAYREAQAICASPPTDTVTAITALSRIAGAIAAATTEARTQNPAAAEAIVKAGRPRR